MDYKRNFRELSVDEFVETLRHSSELTFEAQLHLLEIAKERNIQNEEYMSTLQGHIDAEMQEIYSLKYLNHLGFSVDRSVDYLRIVRSKPTRNMDILGFLIGVLLSPSIYNAVVSGRQLIDQGMNGMLILVTTIYVGLSFLSLALIYKTLNRLFEYKGFELSTRGEGTVNIVKALASGTIREEVGIDKVKIVGDESELGLHYNDGVKEIKLITTKGGVRAMETLIASTIELKK
jgi:hypothetical protein